MSFWAAMKAWLEQYQRDHPLQYELLMAEVRQLRRADAQDPDRRPRRPAPGRLWVEHRDDRFDHDAEPFGHPADESGLPASSDRVGAHHDDNAADRPL